MSAKTQEEKDLEEAIYLSQLEAAMAASLMESSVKTPSSSSSYKHQKAEEKMTDEELAFFTDAKIDFTANGRKNQPSTTPAPAASGKAPAVISPTNNGYGSINSRGGSEKTVPPPSQAKPTAPSSSSSTHKAPAPSTNARGGNIAGSGAISSALLGLLGGSTATAGGLGSILGGGLGNCTICGESLQGRGRYLTVNDSFQCHADCFLCTACLQPMDTSAFSMRENLPYHPACSKELFNPRCCLCNCAMEGQYMRHPFFEQEMYCTTHVSGTGGSNGRTGTIQTTGKQCFACGRREPLKSSGREGFQTLTDGRALCPICVSSIIMDSQEAQALYIEICNFMEFHLQLNPIPVGMRKVPVLVVDMHTMQEQARQEGIGGVGRGGSSGRNGGGGRIHEGLEGGETGGTVRGLTLSTRRGEVRYYLGNNSFSSFNLNSTTTEQRDVTAVLVLFGLPRDLFASILSHEAMHVWCKLTKALPFDMPAKIEEGLCQLVAYKFLEYLSESEKNNSKLNHFFSLVHSSYWH